jgi:hypothetical protein
MDKHKMLTCHFMWWRIDMTEYLGLTPFLSQLGWEKGE